MTSFAITRRTLLAACGAAVATRGLTSRAAQGTLPWKLGIQLYSLRGYPVAKALEHARDLGFEAVEFFPGMLPIALDNSVALMRDKVQGLGLAISAAFVGSFSKDTAANRKLFEYGKLLGVRTLVGDPAPDSFDSLDELVKEYDMRVAIHNHGPGHRYNKAIDVLRVIENRDKRIGACADLGHYIRSGERPVEVIRLLADRIYGVHLKDFAEMKGDAKGVVLGKGHIDAPAVFAALKQANFPADGALSLEYEETPQDPLDAIRECVEAARAGMAAV
jgi:sugar phosphate isomerase/epimerase